MSDWRRLLRAALPALDEVFDAKGHSEHSPDWTVGGGAAIAEVLDHRETVDVDIFIQNGRLKDFTPRLNKAAAAISDVVQWSGHYLKFERPDGEIDFLSARLQTEPGYHRRRIDGRDVALETPQEVVVKKLRFRSATFSARDVFDLAAVAIAYSDLASVLAEEAGDTLPRVREAVRIHRMEGAEALGRSVKVTARGRNLLPLVFDAADRVLTDAQAIVDGRAPEKVVDSPTEALRRVSRGPSSPSGVPGSARQIGRDEFER